MPQICLYADWQQSLQRLQEGRHKIERLLRQFDDELEKLQPTTGDALISTRSEVEAEITECDKQLAGQEGTLKRVMRAQREAEDKIKELDEKLNSGTYRQKRVSIKCCCVG